MYVTETAIQDTILFNITIKQQLVKLNNGHKNLINYLRGNQVLNKATALNYINNNYLFHTLSYLLPYNVTLI